MLSRTADTNVKMLFCSVTTNVKMVCRTVDTNVMLNQMLKC